MYTVINNYHKYDLCVQISTISKVSRKIRFFQGNSNKTYFLTSQKEHVNAKAMHITKI